MAENEFKRGWSTVLAAATGTCVGSTGLAFYTFGIFVKPLTQAFGWSRAEVSLGMTWITIGAFLCAPGVGWLIDRFGVKRVAAPSLVGLAIAYALLSRVGASITSFYLACMALAVLGCGTSPVSWTRAVGAFFSRNRGLALGLTLLGSATASLVGAPVVQAIISAHGFRAGYLAMAAFTILITLPAVVFLMKTPGEGGAPAAVESSGLSLGEAARTAPFWLLALGIVMLITAQSGLIIHLVPMLTDRGMSATEAAGIAGLMGLSVFVSRLGIGALLDRLNPAMVSAAALVCPAVAAVILAISGGNPVATTAAVILLGLSAGAEIDLLAFFAARFFGMRSYGRIYGFLFAMFTAGNGLGAPLMGAVYDHWKTYVPALWIAAGLFLAGAVMFGALGRYKPFEDPISLR